jgi:hypothetical protein
MAAVAHHPLVDEEHCDEAHRADSQPDWPTHDGDEKEKQHHGHATDHHHGHHREAAVVPLWIPPTVVLMLSHRYYLLS